MKALAVRLIALGAVLVAATAHAADPPAVDRPGEEEAQLSAGASVAIPVPRRAPANEDRSVTAEPRHDFVRLNAGLRVGYLPGRGFDAFADDDVLTQLSIDGTYPLLSRGKLVLAAGLGWDVGGRSGTMRGFTSSMTAHRLYVPLEGRYHVRPWIYGFAKLAPGAAAVIASVEDGTTPAPLAATGWAFSADASLGASVLIGPRKPEDRRTLRFWVTPELGYAFTTNAPLSLNPGRDQDHVLGSDQNTRLSAVALSGFFWRASAGVTF